MKKNECYSFIIDYLRQTDDQVELSMVGFEQIFKIMDGDRDGLISKLELKQNIVSTFKAASSEQ